MNNRFLDASRLVLGMLVYATFVGVVYAVTAPLRLVFRSIPESWIARLRRTPKAPTEEEIRAAHISTAEKQYAYDQRQKRNR